MLQEIVFGMFVLQPINNITHLNDFTADSYQLKNTINRCTVWVVGQQFHNGSKHLHNQNF